MHSSPYLNNIKALQYIKSFANDLLDFVYPEFCIGCNDERPANKNTFCIRCLGRIQYTDHFEIEDNELRRRLLGRVEPSFAAALYGFIKGGSVQKAVHRLKYEQRPDIGESFGRQYGELLQASPYYIQPDILVPIPLHYTKKEIRGYNQSTRVARGIAEVIKVPIVEDCLVKTKDLVSQTRKGREDRFVNVLNSFELKKRDKLLGKHVMLVDDVVTTGATFEAAVTLLLNHLPDLKIQLAAIALAHD